MAGTSGTDTGSGRRFSLLRILGEGSFGCVYLADMEGAGGFKRRVALKLLNDSWDPSSDAGRRLRDEARLLGRLEHGNIVRVDDLVQLNGRWALVMEYVSGADVEAVFAWAERRSEPIPPRAAVEICASIADALVAAYDAAGDQGEPLRVVHRDIKPSNVRLTDSGQVKVLDFGVARAQFAGREAHTERVRYGSLGYMAPERILGAEDTPAGDVYALAVMAYELLTLKTYGRAELGLERQAQQVDTARDALEASVGDGPLVVLLVRALAYTPEDRPSASEMARELHGFARGLPGSDLPTFARATLPHLINAQTSDTAFSGGVLNESGGTPAPASRVSSATLVVDASTSSWGTDDDPTTQMAVAPPTSRAPLYVGALVAAVLVLVLGFVLLRPGPPDVPPTASVPAAPTPAGASVAEPVPAPIPAPIPASPAPDVAAVASVGTAPPPPAALTAPAGRPPAGATTRSTKAAATPPIAPPPPEASPAPTAPSGPRLRAAKFTLTGAEGIRVTCGDVTGTGSSNTLLRDFPPGDCTVAAAGKTTIVRLDAPGGVACAIEGDSLACR